MLLRLKSEKGRDFLGNPIGRGKGCSHRVVNNVSSLGNCTKDYQAAEYLRALDDKLNNTVYYSFYQTRVNYGIVQHEALTVDELTTKAGFANRTEADPKSLARIQLNAI